MRYEIKGDNLPTVICHLEDGESMTCEGGAMSWMSPNIEMTTEGGGSLGKAIGRMFSGEKIFRNVFTAHGEGLISFSSNFPGHIIPVEITEDTPIIVQKSGFLASTMGLQTEVAFNKKVGAGLFGGEGFIMEKVYGKGIAFLEVDGSAVEYELAAGEKMIVSTGHIASMSASCDMDIQAVKGAKNVLFGSESLFNSTVTGPGKLILQTMPIKKFVGVLKPYLPQPSSNSSNHD